MSKRNCRRNVCCPGPRGPAGPEGPQGPEGPEGPQGPAGSNGTSYLKFSGGVKGESIEKTVLKGFLADTGVAPPLYPDGHFVYPTADPIQLKSFAGIVTGLAPGQSGTFIIQDLAGVFLASFPFSANGLVSGSFGPVPTTTVGLFLAILGKGPFDIAVQATIGHS